ncbi:hypothetical protein AB2S32_15385 [Elizabethkingia anophelis]|uniref:Uncharacterized protein n=1 Tax=Elizabethkingia anophelis R26 TaxID=1246994 RepID=A0ABM6MYF9_9FLAO|nr:MULTISPECIES: hypothetical protein [Elizabethkingia]ATC38227.1 hypothetical protein BAZ09_008820 [Elizabethkingia anophelis R26]ATC41910.1 hypothetical protein EAAG1_009035 [Elizabethkingia anophelis Ag1]ATC43666.1 hypothetical protein CMV41_09035 [Elizabethkingia anophelis]ATC47342.1 hypothetical protein CMV40_09035 [Elizabethkingia anophelis]ELR80213.1 hypothetical protein D505_05839 [Elizabethkingia anophelis R26]
MKKTLLSTSLWGILALSTLTSCRTEDNLNQQNQAEDKRFAVFVSKSPGEKIDYAKGFSSLYQNYYEVNDISTKDQKTIANDFGVVDFGLHTQLLTYNNGTKAMFFPLIKENKIDGIVMAVLEKGDTSLRYTKLEESYKNYSDILNGFIALEKMTRKDIIHISSDRSLVGGSFIAIAPPAKDPPILYVNGERNEYDDNNGSGSNSNNETLIPGVTITVPKPQVPLPPPSPMNPTNPTPPINPGGCGSYGGCSNSGSGGAGSGAPSSQSASQWAKEHIDASALKNNKCADEVYQKLKDNSAFFNNLLGKFEGNSILDLKFEIKDLKVPAKTEIENVRNGYVTIAFNPNYLGSSELGRASLFIHEMLHAYMTWQLKQAGWDGLDNAISYKSIDEKNLPDLLKAYKEKNYERPGASEHEFISNFYIPKIVNALKAYDPNLGTDSEYEKIAWAGLQETDSYKNKSNKDTYDSIIWDNIKKIPCGN